MSKIFDVPEIGNLYLTQMMALGMPLVDESVEVFLSPIWDDPKKSKVINIGGGMGEVAEFLSQKGVNIRLVQDQRLFYVYRSKLFPKSKVIEMNIDPNSIKSVDKQYYEYAIIHNNKWLDLAKKIAKFVYNVETKEVHGKVNVDNTKKPIINTKEQDISKAVIEPKKISRDSDISVDNIAQSGKTPSAVDDNYKFIGDLEQ